MTKRKIKIFFKLFLCALVAAICLAGLIVSGHFAEIAPDTFTLQRLGYSILFFISFIGLIFDIIILAHVGSDFLEEFFK